MTSYFQLKTHTMLVHVSLVMSHAFHCVTWLNNENSFRKANGVCVLCKNTISLLADFQISPYKSNNESLFSLFGNHVCNYRRSLALMLVQWVDFLGVLQLIWFCGTCPIDFAQKKTGGTNTKVSAIEAGLKSQDIGIPEMLYCNNYSDWT